MELKAGYKQTEVGVIPEDWEVSEVGQTCSHVTTGKLDANAMDENGAYRFYTCAKDYYRIDTYAFDCEALLISGNGAHVGYIHYYAGKFNAYQRTYVLSGFTSAIKFVQHYLDENFRKRIQVEVKAGGTPYITRDTITESLIPLPPTKAEQEAIAEALSDADALIESLEQLIAKKRQIKQGAMQELLTGKKRLPGFSGEWEEETLGGLASLWKGSSNPGLYPEKLFTHFSLPAFDDGAKPVTEPGSLIGSNKFTVPPSAVLLSKLNPRIPRIWAPDEIPENAVCSTEFLVLLPNDETDREFLATLCSSNVVCDQMKLHATGTTGSHQRIHPPQALAIEVFIPTDPDEQTAIATILSDMDAEIAALETKLAKARQVKQGMMQELLTGKTRLV